MIPKRVVLENFLSFGKPATEIVFADDEPLWVLGGPNGVGKSAVFDAITYCLFGEHRGGQHGADLLIRHGANGLHVQFEFEFDGTDYRITRNLGGRSTQRVEQRNPDTGEWKPIAGVNSVKYIRAWSERLLGLGFPAFSASVLLRQGEADKIITAGGTDRLKILKRIIDAERFEELSKRVHDAKRSCDDRLSAARNRRDNLREVTQDALDQADAELERTEGALSTAKEDVTNTTARMAEAKNWAELDGKLNDVQKLIHDADQRAANERGLRADKARLDDLTAAVPRLRSVVELRTKLAKWTSALADREADQQRVVAALTAHNLRREIKEDSEYIEASDEVSAFPADLEEQCRRARQDARGKSDLVTRAVSEKAEAEGLRKQARKRQTEFKAIGVGVKCSRCGQVVSEEHASREREEIDREVRELDKRCNDAISAEEKATGAKSLADADLEAENKLQQEYRTAATRFDQLTRTRTDNGESTNVEAVRQALTTKKLEAIQSETSAGDLVSVARKTLLERQAEITKKLNADAQLIATDRGTISTQMNQLAADWQAKLDTLDASKVQALDEERQRLVASRVTEQVEQLERDAVRREEWAKQRDALTEEINKVPESSRISLDEAERQVRAAQATVTNAEKTRDAARKVAEQLHRDAEDRRKFADEVTDAERDHDLHEKLDTLIGKHGLQREIVRTAEREIVSFANQTVQHLSDGDLSIELDDAGDDEAFALRIRRADDPIPIGVHFLSGSQKFRVAVSVALAIGRFAAGHTRRLESVIIDEGFGSLDRDGLTAMADELNRLKQFLRRIILVSHQEEFASRFPVVIKLSRGPDGTIATPQRLSS